MMMVIANNPELFIYRFIYYSFNFNALKYCVRIFNQQKNNRSARLFTLRLFNAVGYPLMINQAARAAHHRRSFSPQLLVQPLLVLTTLP
jgi:hypothetical protein